MLHAFIQDLFQQLPKTMYIRYIIYATITRSYLLVSTLKFRTPVAEKIIISDHKLKFLSHLYYTSSKGPKNSDVLQIIRT